MITNLKIGDKVILKKPTNIFEQIGIPSDLSFDKNYTVDGLQYSSINKDILRIGISEQPYTLYYIELFESSLKSERRDKLNKLNKI